jgi:hypothetical protein
MGTSYRTEEEPVKVPLVRVYLESETSSISDAVCRSPLSYSRREAGKETGLFTHLAQEVSLGEIRDVVSDFEDAISSGTFGVDKTGELKLATIPLRAWLIAPY